MTITATRPDTWATVEAAQAGDPDAFAAIWHAHHPYIFRFIHLRIAHRQTAEDLAATTFEKALRSICGVRWQGRDIAAWLTVIAGNLVKDWYKSGRNRFERLALSSGADQIFREYASDDRADHQDKPDPAPTPADQTEAYLRNRVLAAAVAMLTEGQRDVITCRFYRGLTVEETARELGLNEGAVKAAQYRACVTLRRLLTGAGWAP